MTPLLTIYAITLSVLGGAVPMLLQDYTLAAYMAGVIDAVTAVDLLQAMVKGAAFGLIVGVLGCYHGLHTGQGADAVGLSTTRAVVAGIVVVLLADSVISSVFYSLGQ